MSVTICRVVIRGRCKASAIAPGPNTPRSKLALKAGCATAVMARRGAVRGACGRGCRDARGLPQGPPGARVEAIDEREATQDDLSPASTLSSAPRTTHRTTAAPDRLASPPARQSPRPARRAGPAGRPRASPATSSAGPRTAPRPCHHGGCAPSLQGQLRARCIRPRRDSRRLAPAADHDTADRDAHPSSPVSLARRRASRRATSAAAYRHRPVAGSTRARPRHEADIAGPRPPPPAPPRDIDERGQASRAEAHRQHAPQIELGIDALIGVKRHEIRAASRATARRARVRPDAARSSDTIRVDHKAPARQRRDASATPPGQRAPIRARLMFDP